MSTVRVYLQSELLSDTRMLQIDEHAGLAELRRAAIALLPAGSDSADFSLTVEDDDGRGPAAGRVKDLDRGHGVRVHLHRCKKIAVEVRFSGHSVSHDFPPATTIGHIRKWAGKALGMDPADVAEHVLQIVGSNVQPALDVHVGSLTQHPKCSVAFDLVPAHRVNG